MLTDILLLHMYIVIDKGNNKITEHRALPFHMYIVIYTLINIVYGNHESAYYDKDNTLTLYIIHYTQLYNKNVINYKITQSHYKQHKTVFKKIVNYKITLHIQLYI